ncbi:CDP-alcohol phosphatidyltransferase family protein [Dactylosporangium siamense]|uniref:CDP-alcohol phosphatidyltransferase family protein n=1 Tax=Dactylosporangium siamense TaxID=685454 RepID=UPI001941760D|nr:CDP-alcohol phosphatidyltransferase family protein [Dactylosporangium siamense]
MRRSGSLARQVLFAGRVGRRGDGNVAGATALLMPPPTETDAREGRVRLPRLRMRRRDGLSRDVVSVAPVSPAVPPLAVAPDDGPGLSIPLLPGERTVARRIRFALVNACTISSLLLGLAAIFIAVNHGDVRIAATLLIACVVFDGLDGFLARRLGVASPFGAQMDSLADMCSFGLAAPVVVYAWLNDSAPAAVLMPACGLVAACAAIRLARFNVSPKDGRFFCGVPTTMCAAVLALATLIAPEMPPVLRVAGVAVLGLAMVSSFPYAKLARLAKLPPWLFVLPVVGALVDFRLTFVAVVLAYLVSGPVLWLRQRRHVTA